MDNSKTNETNSPPPPLLPQMDHQEALRQMAVEKYVLDEMTPAMRDQFEQHFFDCPECAADLRATSAFFDQAKRQLGEAKRRAIAKPAKRSWVPLLFRPMFVSPIFAAMLLVIVYQSFSSKEASSDVPEVLSSASLIGGNSRGGTDVPLAVGKGKPILLSVDVPTQEGLSNYELVLTSPAGETLWRVPISAEQAKDTVSVRVPTARWIPGEYGLIIFGSSDDASQAKDLAHYRFNFSNETKLNTGR